MSGLMVMPKFMGASKKKLKNPKLKVERERKRFYTEDAGRQRAQRRKSGFLASLGMTVYSFPALSLLPAQLLRVWALAQDTRRNLRRNRRTMRNCREL